jgi:acyl carrier protein
LRAYKVLLVLQDQEDEGMDEAQIYARLAEIIAEVFDQGVVSLTPDLRIEDMEGWDSLSHVRLILTIEKSFKIKFLTSEMRNLETVQDLVSAIKARA